MNKYLAGACGAALVIAAASFGYAQTPPGTDRKGGESSQQSANPDMDKSGKKQTNQGSGGSPTVGTGTPTPPGTDRQGGDLSQGSANPRPDKK